MKKQYLTLVFLGALSCGLNKELRTVTFSPGKGEKLVAEIPKGYFLKYKTGGLDESHEYLYNYADSSLIYFTDQSNGGANYQNIRDADQYDKLFSHFLAGDTITLQGIDNNGKYWKHRSLSNYSIGYLNVNQGNKEKFDSVISNAQKK